MPQVIRAAVVSLALIGPALPAQTIAGRVIDRASRRPAQRVEIQVIADSGAVLARAATDTAGVFAAMLSRPARVRLHFAIGGVLAFVSDTMTIASDDYVERAFALVIPRDPAAGQVERHAILTPGTMKMIYPPLMRREGIEGLVIASFVVDSTGLALMETFRVSRATNSAFVPAVRAAVAAARFKPAENGSHRVAELVQQPFDFKLERAASDTAGFPPPLPPRPLGARPAP